jgi:cytochrome c553
MKINLPVLALLAITMLSSCKESKTTNYTSPTQVATETPAYTASNHPGKKLLETQCYVCHSPSADHDGRIAPPMVAIKSHYMSDDTTKEQFANAMWSFVEKPTEEKSKMRGAVKRFGVMPYQPFNKEDIRLIAEYMYDYKIEEPEWFKQHIEEESKGKMKYRNGGKNDLNAGAKKEQTPVDRGLEYALTTKKELGKNLMGTIQKKGTLEAVKFCNVRAYPITDSMAVAQSATIKRVTDRPRNPENQANSKELKIIEDFKNLIAQGESYEPVTEIENGEVNFYYPIVTNSMCLQCHGNKGKEIEPAVFTALSTLYPSDKAVGYDVNQVRGIWSISYEN